MCQCQANAKQVNAGLPCMRQRITGVCWRLHAEMCGVCNMGRYPSEADAQSLRVAVLLDELDFPGIGQPDPRLGHIVIELKTSNAVGPDQIRDCHVQQDMWCATETGQLLRHCGAFQLAVRGVM